MGLLARALRPSLLDRYIVREILPPTGLGLLLFSFILLLNEITRLTGILIARGADLPTILRLFLNILPSIFSITIPMAFLLGVLLAFGRLASDSEIVALRASGVSPGRLLRPVVALSLVMGLATFYIMAVALPQANQTYRQVFYALVVSKAKTGIKARVFNDDLVPGMVLYISDIPADTGEWRDLFISDTRNPAKPRLILAREGSLVIDEPRKAVELHLTHGVLHSFDPVRPEEYDQSRFMVADFPLPYEQFFPQIPLTKGDRELTLGELQARIRELSQAKNGRLQAAPYAVEWHKKFAIPAACLVFGVLGLGLSLGSRKEARSAAFALSIAVIFVYYIVITLGERAGDTLMLPPWLSMWGANLLLGAAAVVLIVLNHREAAFDPLDPRHYALSLPRIRRRARRLAAPAGRRRAPPRPVVVIRVPRLSFRFPSILDGYIARAFFGKLAMVLLAFTAIYVVVEFTQLFDDIQQNRVKGMVAVHYFNFKTPSIVHQMMPVAVLVSVLVTLGILARRNEITAMKAGGISVYRTSVPVVAAGIGASLTLFAMGEFLLPFTNRVVERDFSVIKGRPPRSYGYMERRWILGSDNRIYNYDYLAQGREPDDVAFYSLNVFDIDQARWELRDRLFASRAVWKDAAYELERGWRRTFGEHGGFRSFYQSRTREIEAPAYFKQEDRDSEALGFAALRAHIARLESLGLDVVKLRVQLHKKLAFPVVCVVMTLIGIPFAFVVARGGALYGVGISLLIAIVYWATIAIFDALGNTAYLPALLAAWSPNVIFGATGLYLMLTLET